MKRIHDISDKGLKAGKRLRYEVGYFCTPHGVEFMLEEDITLCAKFRAYGDAYRYAESLANSPDPLMVIIRN